MVAHRIVLAALVAVMLISVAPEASGAVGTPIVTCGQVVVTNAYLTSDLYCPGGAGWAAVIVGASNITIDLKGFTLRGDNSARKDGIADNGHDGLTVQNGVIRNFYFGVIAIAGADNITVTNVVASGNGGNAGILIEGDSAKVQSSNASGNAEIGIWVIGNATSVKSSTASGNGAEGFYIEGDMASIESSTASGNGAEADVLGFFSTDGVFVVGDAASLNSLTASGNLSSGIAVHGDAASIQSSTASGNQGVAGIYVSGDAAQIHNDRAEANGFDATGASNTGGFGIRVHGYTTPPAGVNTARGNDDPAECQPAFLC